MQRLILCGNPNVGKSALFTRLTGVHTTIANYAGTTVSYKRGRMLLAGQPVEVIDTPGAYSLDPGNEAERVAADLCAQADLVINVVDATNLERNLLLTMQLLEQGKPLVLVLNMADDAQHKGIHIDVPELGRILRVPVVPTVAVSGDGIAELTHVLAEAAARADRGEPFPRIRPHGPDEKWTDLGRILQRVQTLTHRHHTFLEVLQDLSVHPLLGPLAALALLAMVFVTIRTLGEGLIRFLLDPLFHNLYLPVMTRFDAWLAPWPLLRHALIGVPIHGQIDFQQSMGMLTTGLYVELAVVLPYLLAFYLVLSLLEDIGYLPRLSVVMDALLHRIGLHGFSVIPILLGFGCNVPGLLATRSLETRQERFVACTLISIGVPCVSLQAMIFKIVGEFGGWHVAAVYLYLAAVTLLLGCLMKWTLRGFLPEMILEIPPYRRPKLGLIGRKLYYRTRGFLFEATPLILGGILLMNVLDYLGLFRLAATVLAPVTRGIWGLPDNAILPILMGFLRKDVAAGMLIPLQLTHAQTMTACVLLSLTFPCVASLIVLFHELRWRDALKSVGIMLATAVVFGGLAHLLFVHITN